MNHHKTISADRDNLRFRHVPIVVRQALLRIADAAYEQPAPTPALKQAIAQYLDLMPSASKFPEPVRNGLRMSLTRRRA